MKIVGLTGGIASGKSTVSEFLKQRGFPVLDADKIAREIVQSGSDVLKILVREFGDEILLESGELNRSKLRNIVFNDKNKLNRLNEITHPEIRKRLNEQIIEYKKYGFKLIIVDAALLIEAKFYELVDIIILVYVDLNTQIERLIKRDNISKDDAFKIINSQMKLEEKIKYADYIIDNTKDFEYTKMQVNKIINSIKSSEECNE
ncbi:Dephospho-CoA kinase [Caloramator mitchellensis]|uniref:Dephospho-CoA kinase n=1 Tax=Caloramator mitchellensis TaxID=908809 RepID=A0A0R3K6R5_CALMK|nr:dephospho-CoA kinase [Caloramator mitchellensis]KRQ88127.1 Dephospho-CoA kinase [Caloramator mitchellensis]